MTVSITRTKDAKAPPLVLTIYSQGGVGKSTLAATSPNPVFLDSEQGTKAFGARGIDVPVVHIASWADVSEAWQLVKNEKTFETIVIDPVGTFLDLLVEEVKMGGDMNLKKWGEVKDRMRRFIWTVKDSGKHVVFVAHEKEEKDDEQVLRRPLLAANLWQELVNLCDVVGHLRIDAAGKRTLRVQPELKCYAKDRFDALGSLIENPNIKEIIKKVHDAYDKPPFEDKEPASTHGKKMIEGIKKAGLVTE